MEHALKLEKDDRGILVVAEDEEVIRELLVQAAENLGFAVHPACDGHEALELVRKVRPDAVISDVKMPRLGGLSLLTQLRSEGYNYPFVVVTGYADTDTTIQALRLGAFDFFEKPFHMANITAVMNEAVRAGRAQRELLERAGAPQTGDKSMEDVEVQIMRLRTLRFMCDGEYRQDANQPPVRGRTRLVEMLVMESMPQLAFCEAGLAKMSDKEQRRHEMAYMFRVMRTLRVAATGLGLSKVAMLATSAENFCTHFRIRTESLKDDHLQTFREALGALRMLLAAGEGDDAQGGVDTGLLKRLDSPR